MCFKTKFQGNKCFKAHFVYITISEYEERLWQYDVAGNLWGNFTYNIIIDSEKKRLVKMSEDKIMNYAEEIINFKPSCEQEENDKKWYWPFYYRKEFI